MRSTSGGTPRSASVGSHPCRGGVTLGIGVRLPLNVVVIVFVLAMRAAVEDVECGARRRSRRAAQEEGPSIGQPPQPPSSGRMMCRVSPAGHRPAARAADLSGKRLTQWAETVLARAAR